MTIDEAIAQLKDLRKDREGFLVNDDELDSEFAKDIEAIDMAVKALEENSELKRLLRESMSTMKVIADTYREEAGNDGICGLCEFDGAIQGESGDWYPECPGFERDDCFKWKHAEEAMKLLGDDADD